MVSRSWSCAPMSKALLGSSNSRVHGLCTRARAINVRLDRKSTRLNSSHSQISYAVFCLKKKKPKSHIPDFDKYSFRLRRIVSILLLTHDQGGRFNGGQASSSPPLWLSTTYSTRSIRARA